jgi:phosphoribosylformimino-5-aminoimidazole carboxamide ribotide isomerase
MEVIPAIDLLGGGAVRLRRGDYDEVVFRGDPLELARRFGRAGAGHVHLVDLDGARGRRVRPALVAAVAEAAAPAAVQAAGGVRSVVDAGALLDAGAARVVVGTAAFREPGALDPYVAALGDRLVVALDVRDGELAVTGWTERASVSLDAAIARCVEAGVERLLCTAVARDGTFDGPDLELLAHVVEASGLPVLAAGGISSEDDLGALETVGVEAAIVGRAVVEGRVPLTVLSRS